MSAQTDRRRTEEKLAQAQRMESVGRLAGGIAHDLNNMLTAIVGYSSFLAADLPDSDRRREDVLEILKAAERSAGLTRSLLAFARREIIQPEHLDMNLVIRDMSRMLRPALGENIELVLELKAEPAMVYADRARLEQVLLNLVLNARDAMPRGGRLMIASGNVLLGPDEEGRHPEAEIPAGNYLRIAVSDTGLGMDPEILARVFEPFFTTKPVGEGTGLGLATAYGTIKQSRGFIWAYSEPSHGSAFHVYLPEIRTAAKVEDIFEQTRPSRLGGSETILVVEDEEVVRELAARSLRSEGYTAITAAGAREALDLLRHRASPVSLVISDLVMPGIGGRELAEQIRRDWPETPILFTSGFTDDDVIRRGLMESGEPFLQKPWGPDSLLRIVRSLLDQGVSGLRSGEDQRSEAIDSVRPGAKRGAG
jgi:nitrogen-specific signal transduction histidine kinase/FixJ family two-component response regulator